jgi:chromosome segregation ATPase
MKASIICLWAALALASITAPAQEASPVEAKLRDTLRNTMIQLRTAETERARLDAELVALKASSEKEIKALKAQFEEAVKRAADEKSTADKLAAEQTIAIRKRDERIKALDENLDKWKAEHVKITEIARKKEAARAEFEAKATGLSHVVADRERKNLELFRLGNEILGRYETFALGRALLAREPFTGITRVKLEEQVQDYRDKINGQFVKSGEPATAP